MKRTQPPTLPKAPRAKQPFTVAVVGRPNVGKSSLVNRIIGRREAIVDDRPGVTRDRLSYPASWQNHKFSIIDTGGIYNDGTAIGNIDFQQEIEEQAQLAIAASQLVILVVDGKAGLHPLDRELALALHKSSLPLILAVNKLDNQQKLLSSYEFYELAIDRVLGISALNGLGVAELLDQVVANQPTRAQTSKNPAAEAEAINIAIVGKPNAGKSTLLNTLLGEVRSIVSDQAGTTRDSVDAVVVRKPPELSFYRYRWHQAQSQSKR